MTEQDASLPAAFEFAFWPDIKKMRSSFWQKTPASQLRPGRTSMKNSNARTTFSLALVLCYCLVLALARQVDSGEYYIYQKANGQLVLSNYAPPRGSSVITKKTLSEVTDQQIRESELRENQLVISNRLASLEKSVDELTENLRAQREVMNDMPEAYGDTNIAVGVVQGIAAPAKPLHRRFDHPRRFGRRLPSVHPRPFAPTGLCCGGGRVR